MKIMKKYQKPAMLAYKIEQPLLNPASGGGESRSHRDNLFDED